MSVEVVIAKNSDDLESKKTDIIFIHARGNIYAIYAHHTKLYKKNQTNYGGYYNIFVGPNRLGAFETVPSHEILSAKYTYIVLESGRQAFTNHIRRRIQIYYKTKCASTCCWPLIGSKVLLANHP